MMQKIVTLLLIFITFSIVSQQKVLKELTVSTSDELIEIETYGLDDVVIENSIDNKLQVLLIDENTIPLNVEVKKTRNTIQLSFKRITDVFQKEVFRKYITKRIERARVLLKIPVNKKVIIHGRNIGVNSKSYKGSLDIYIEKGNVYLGKVYSNTSVKLFLGNVFANLDENMALDLKTSKGKIEIDNKEVSSPFLYKKGNVSKLFKINSINANINLLKK